MKRRASPNRQTAGVSLFPFLAVLLCTMGALIVVLVVIARHARMQVAEAARRDAASAAQSELALKRGDLEWRISELKKSRQEAQKLLDQKQLELSHLEEHARRLRGQLEESAATRENFSELAAGDERENEELKSKLSRLLRDAERTKAEIDKLRRRSGGSGESYAIIPYRGPNETRRRPIYIECRKDLILLQPEGIALSEQDFLVDLGPSNPLVSALRAVREYHLRNQLAGKGEAGTPYPLFIIRPDGIEMSYEARQAITSWGSEFGYELVGQDWSFDFPPADPMLALAMRQAVSQGRLRQAYFARAAPRLSHAGSHATFRASPHGGLVQVEGSPGGGGGRRHGQARPSGLPRRRFGGGRGGSAGSGGGGGNGSGSSNGLVASPAVDGGGPIHSVDGDDNPYISALGPGAIRGGPVAGGTGLSDGSTGTMFSGGRYAGSGAGGFQGNGARGNGARGGPPPGPAGSPLRRYGRGGPAGTPDGRGGSPPANLLALGGGGAGRYPGGGSISPAGRAVSDAAAGPANRLGLARGNGQPGGTRPQGNPSGRADATGNRGTGPATGNSPAGSPPTKAATYRGRPGGTPGGSTSGTSPSGTPDREPPLWPAPRRRAPRCPADQVWPPAPMESPRPRSWARAPRPARPCRARNKNGRASRVGKANSPGEAIRRRPMRRRPAAQPAAPAAEAATRPSETAPPGSEPPSARSSGGSGSASSSSASSSQQSSASGGGASSASQSPQASGMPSPLNTAFGQQNAPQSVAQQRGEKNWANPDASTTNVAIERPIRVVCDAEHLTLLPEGRGKQGMRVIPLRSRTAESVDDLVASVWDRIDSWGTAGRGMYWRPTLIMEVEPGGQRRYAELQSLLADSGFDVHGKPRRKFFGVPRR